MEEKFHNRKKNSSTFSLTVTLHHHHAQDPPVHIQQEISAHEDSQIADQLLQQHQEEYLSSQTWKFSSRPDYTMILKASQEEFQKHRSSMDHHQLGKFLMSEDLHLKHCQVPSVEVRKTDGIRWYQVLLTRSRQRNWSIVILLEIARDPNLPLLIFGNITDLVSSFPRQSHDGLYRAIDMYLKEHPETLKNRRSSVYLSLKPYTSIPKPPSPTASVVMRPSAKQS